jgi:peptidoglycan/xylan/chitin deacetylase (PgdA/CDA1 family)
MKALIKQLIPSSIIRYRCPTSLGKIALSFDDGPKPGTTERVLEALANVNMTATFFVLGTMAEAQPDLCRSIISQGHEIGNHGYSHTKFTEMSNTEINKELEKTDAIIKDITGNSPTLIRPPNGAISLRVLWYLYTRRKQPAVLWSQLIENEWQKSEQALLDDVEKLDLHSGDILLLHDVNDGTIAALPDILKIVMSKNLHGSSISSMQVV